MTHEQSARESQAADEIREAIVKQTEQNIFRPIKELQDSPGSSWYGKAMESVKDFANWGNEIGEMVKEGPAGQAFDTARHTMADINRRVIEEPWFGKPVADILFERQQSPMQRDRNVDQDVGKQTQQQENFWENFFGQQQAAEREQQQGPEMGR